MSIFPVHGHQPKHGEKYLLDCNVLMYNFYTNGSYAATLRYDYSVIVTKIISAGAKLVMTDVLLSEFVNTYVQAEFHRLAGLNHWPHSKEYFKRHFKSTAEYHDILQELKIICFRQIFPVFTLLAIDFPQMPLEDIFDHPETFDFNDRYYGKVAKELGAYVVTNDADFSEITDINILTGNANLLSHC